MTRAGISGLKLAVLVLGATAVVLGVNLFLNQELGAEANLSAQPRKNFKTQPVASESRTPLNRYRQLMTSRTFQTDSAKPRPNPGPSQAKLPRLEGYRLVGVMAGPRTVASAVVEETSTGRQEMVGLGESLGAGVLVAVLPDRVVVEVNGQRRQLALPDKTEEEMAAVLTLKNEVEPTPGRRPLASSQAGPAGPQGPGGGVTDLKQ